MLENKVAPVTAQSPAPAADQSEGGLGQLRVLGVNWSRLVGAIAIATAVFHIWTAYFGALTGTKQAVVHLGLVLVMAFLVRPFGRKSPFTRPSLMDMLWIGGSLASIIYLIVEDSSLPNRVGLVYNTDIVLGIVLVAALLESSRRLMGWELSGFALATIVYAFIGPWMPSLISHRGFDVEEVVGVLYLTTEGIFGDALQVSASFIVLFTILGALMQLGGAGQFFTDLAHGMFGRVRGGSAKVSVVGSGLFGMISGSAIANVASVGTFTIPLMIRTGFAPRFAASVEAVGSTGGQFVPPVMGSAAFMIAQILNIPYFAVAVGAAIPALLYYVGLFVTVDLRAASQGIRGLPKSELPGVWDVLRKGFHLFLIPGSLIWFMGVDGYSPGKSAVFSIVVAVLILVLHSVFHRPKGEWPQLLGFVIGIHGIVAAIAAATNLEFGIVGAGAILLLMMALHRLWPSFLGDFVTDLTLRVGNALRVGAIGVLEVGLSCACAGIAIGMLMLTGLGLRLSTVLIDLSGNSLPLLLIFTMIASIILGLGLPTVAAYIVLAVLVAPAMMQLGVDPLAAHLFVFYFGIVSAITPPVALASFAAAAIAGTDPMKTSWQSMRLGFAAYVVPFFMVYNPALIMQGSWAAVFMSAVSACIGVAAFAAALEGFLILPLRWWERVLLLAGALGLMIATPAAMAGGMAALGLCLLSQMSARRRTSLELME